MPCKLVTCPELGSLEMIVYEETPFGIVIDACTRFGPGCELSCPRSCAARNPAQDDDTDDLCIGDTTAFDLELPPDSSFADAAVTARARIESLPERLRAVLERGRVVSSG